MNVIPAGIGVTAVLVLWQGISWFGFVDPFFLPPPRAVGHTLLEILVAAGERNLVSDIGATIGKVVIAFLCATFVGWPMGIVIGGIRTLAAGAAAVIDFFRSIPGTALFPLFLVTLGTGDMSKIALASFVASITVIFHVAQGVAHAKESRILAARSMGMSRWQIIARVLPWESLPHAAAGVREGMSSALVVIVVAEMFIGSSSGLGHRIIDAQITYRIPEVYAVILVAGIMGYVMNLVLSGSTRAMLHWTGK